MLNEASIVIKPGLTKVSSRNIDWLVFILVWMTYKLNLPFRDGVRHGGVDV